MKPKPLIYVLAGAGVLAATVTVGLTCSIGILSGVHFRSNNIDFGSPPPRYSAERFFDWARPADFRPGTIQLNASDYQADPDDAKKTLDAQLQKAGEQEQAGDYQSAIAIYRNLNRHGAGLTGFFTRRVQLLEVAEQNPAIPELKAFLAAAPPSGETQQLPREEDAPAPLKPFIAYEIASRLYDAQDYNKAAKAYQACAHTYPTSVLCEPAMIMGARCLLLDSPARDYDSATINQARGILLAFLSEFPHSRFRENAQGWLARCAFLENKFSEAAQFYEKMAKAATTPEARDSALQSLTQCYQGMERPDLVATAWLRDFGNWQNDVSHAYIATRFFLAEMHTLKPEQAKQFRENLIDDPNLASTYLTVRLDLMNTTKADRQDLTALANEVVQRHPQAGPVWARLAEIAYFDADYETAQANGRHAVQVLGLLDPSWALAEYIIASANMHMGRDSEAGVQYNAVCNTNSFLANSAHEALAFMYDRDGNLDSALNQYYILHAKSKTDENEYQGDYSEDIAYLVDVKMTPAELIALSNNHPDSPHRQEWIYSLGLRYLRKEQFAQAEATFKRLPDAVRRSFAGISKTNSTDQDDPLQDPLQTTKDLAQLTYDGQHGSYEARAKALYQKASYYYTRRGLLLYNAIEWQYARVMSIDDAWNSDIASARDNTALTEHQFDHECLTHAAKICADLVAQYPHSSVAPSALYREACATERLGNENEWWRWEGGRTHTALQASKIMLQIPRLYPHSALSKVAKKYAEAFHDEDVSVHNERLLNKWPSTYKVGWYGG